MTEIDTQEIQNHEELSELMRVRREKNGGN